MQLRDDDKIKQLILDHARGELDEAGERELETWREKRVENEEMFQRVMSMENLEQGFLRFVKSPGAEEKTWNGILARTTRKAARVNRLRWIRYAAMIALPLIVGGMIYFMSGSSDKHEVIAESVQILPGKAKAELVLPGGDRVLLGEGGNSSVWNGVRSSGDTLYYRESEELQPDEKEELHVLRVPRGGEYTLVLADGTTVYLNAESELRYPKQFKGENRKVILVGEAYFDVYHNEQQPFLVEAGGMEVRVLGTSFGVRAYPEEENVLTTLVQGKVNVEADGRVVRLQPGEQADYDKADKLLTTAKVDVNLFVGWKDGRLIFDNAPLEVILSELGRWYSFDVFYANENLKQIPYSLNVRKDEHISGVLKLIERTRKVKFEINNQTIIVK
ncbi:FecR family protein [Butyricimonas paravirosa]|uniref:FecR family protein n=1 Tax=Butyricimonas paravirosa TaxID=1472417 RepID=UPI0021093606|nr:FecR family protein [Butyricimonas paravirosa]MCQ4874341.1 DUF4974 domain-containing protein [Butyricimonas paravirosa]